MRSISRCAISLVLLAALSFISACSETKSADTPRILGNPPEIAYIDVLYEHEFGADGGDNILTYRIVDAPSWLNIESINGVKPSFRIYGVPKLDESENFNTYEETPFDITLEVSDGPRSQQFTYTVTLQKNKVDFSIATVEVNEGKQAEAIAAGVFDEQCKIPPLAPKTVNGKTAYPLPIFVSMAHPSESDVTLRVALTTAFNELKDDRDPSNIRSAKENEDYVSEDRFVTLKAGVQTCLFTVDILDDDIIEGGEAFELTLIEATEGLVEHERPGKSKVTITDNEPSVTFEGEDIILTEGDTSKVYDVVLSKAVDYPVVVNVFADKTSTATADDYTLSATTLTFPPSNTKQSFSVSILDDGDNDAGAATTTKDETVVIKTDVSDIFEQPPLKITINEWDTLTQSAISTNNRQSHALITDNDGNVIVLNSVNNATKDVEIVYYDRGGVSKAFSATPSDSDIASADPADETPVAIDHKLSGNFNELVVLIETEGTLGASHKGNKDVYLRKYSRKVGNALYSKSWDIQIGTASDDVPKGVFIDPQGSVLVYGYSEGTFSADNTNKGNRDAFIAKFDADGNELWTTLIGTPQEDIATGVSFVGTSLIVVGTTKGQLDGPGIGGTDGFIATLNDDGTTKSVHQFGTIYSDEVVGLTSYNNLLRIAGQSKGDVVPPNNETTIPPDTAKNSIDAFYITFNTAYSVINATMWGDDSAPEETSTVTNLTDKSFIGGLTSGVLTDQTSKGGIDATLVSIDSSSINNDLAWQSQFGTGGDDKVVSIDVYGKNKIMVLWESNNGGVISYNISPFSTSGENLLD